MMTMDAMPTDNKIKVKVGIIFHLAAHNTHGIQIFLGFQRFKINLTLS